MAGFKKKTLKEIQADIINEYTTRLRKLRNNDTPLLSVAVLRSLAWAVAGIAYLMGDYLTWVYMQILPQYCSLPILKLWGALLGLDYKTGTSTVLQIEIKDVSALISAGTLWKSLKNGIVYKSLSSVTPVNGIAILSVQAMVAGPVGNLEPDEILDITNPFDGIPDKAVVKSVLVTGSNDEETEVYRKRVLIRFKQKPQGGSFVDYFLWATGVSGIVDALPYVLNSGTNVIYLVAEGSGKNRTPSGSVTPNPFPEWENGNMKVISGSGQFYQVAKSINGTDDMKNSRRPAGAVVELRKCNYTPYRVKISGLTPCTDDMIVRIKNAIVSYLDVRRPHILALGYSRQNAKINSGKISAAVQNTIDFDGGTFSSFVLQNGENQIINEDILGIGCLAYLDKLIINGSDIVL